MQTRASEVAYRVTKWSGRTTGVILFSLIALIMIGEGVPNPLTQPLLIGLGLLCLFGMQAGLIIGLVHPAIGGLAVVGFLALDNALEFAFSGRLLTGGAFPLFVIPGILYLLTSTLGSKGKSMAKQKVV